MEQFPADADDLSRNQQKSIDVSANQNSCSDSETPRSQPSAQTALKMRPKCHQMSLSRAFNNMTSSKLVTSFLYTVVLLLSVMTTHGALGQGTETPEWITEPSDTKIAEFGTQTIYCRIRNRGDRQIAWIQYQDDGNVRNLFIDNAKWAAPDR